MIRSKSVSPSKKPKDWKSSSQRQSFEVIESTGSKQSSTIVPPLMPTSLSKPNPNIDPKVEAQKIVSELEKKQKNNSISAKKRAPGPAETGSLLKHKEQQKSKYSTKPQSNSVTNYVDFDSSDSSLGSFEGEISI